MEVTELFSAEQSIDQVAEFPNECSDWGLLLRHGEAPQQQCTYPLTKS